MTSAQNHSIGVFLALFVMSGPAMAEPRPDLTETLRVCAAADVTLRARVDQLMALGWAPALPDQMEAAARLQAPYHLVLNRGLAGGRDWDQSFVDGELASFTERLQQWFAAPDPVNLPLITPQGDVLVANGRTYDHTETRCLLASAAVTVDWVAVTLDLSLTPQTFPPLTLSLYQGQAPEDPTQVAVLTFEPGAFTGVETLPLVDVASPAATAP